MHLARLFNRSHRLALALWLALLLPLAQAAAVRHEISHLGEQRTQRLDLTAEHCELCLAAAALGSMAPPLQSAAPALLASGDQAVVASIAAGRAGCGILPYQSRAPPSLTT